MRVLLLHPDDNPNCGPWAQQSWDLAFDLGFAGQTAYNRWSERLACPITPVPRLSLEDFSHVRRALACGVGRVVDEYGLDWWELISIRFHEPIERILCLQELQASLDSILLDSDDEVWITRTGFHARVLAFLFGNRKSVRCFSGNDSVSTKLRRAATTAWKFPTRQLLQILGDKYDAAYRMRQWAAPRQRPSSRPVVLLPTAYVNASRIAIAYASTACDCDFLLVTTRQSGWIANPPANVSTARLASYAYAKNREAEYQHLLKCWQDLRALLSEDRELSILTQLGSLDSGPMLREGLAIRDAWLRVFETEPIISVLCADDSNPYTHIPLLIGRHFNFPAIVCHHGALDGRYLFKTSHADIVLAKSRMEEDYLVNTCGVPRKKVVVGAPASKVPEPVAKRKTSIVFFSEPYEIGGGRGEEFYREVLPRLAEIAARSDCELVIKLHPIEIARERRRLVKTVVAPELAKLVRVVEGPLTEDLLQQTFFAVTVLSTAALDCTRRGIPVFRCAWLDHSNYGYTKQFSKFAVGVELGCADEIAKVPSMLRGLAPKGPSDLWQPVEPDELQQLLRGALKLEAAV